MVGTNGETLRAIYAIFLKNLGLKYGIVYAKGDDLNEESGDVSCLFVAYMTVSKNETSWVL
ncbi:hypothetical protein ACUW84_003318 [Bacillus sp. 153480031-1]|nr:hypothetical protein KU48_08015 [Bacillus safensis]MBG9821872.1 hypothetical protein [Bacillus safensis]MDR6683117.1 hypothetical protein [Bacillus safensis]RAU59488.1 hypothetical protein BSAJGB5T_01900 [Bacillus safensis]